MLDLGWQELMLVCVVVVIVVGPKELPKAVRGIAGFMRKIRMMTNEFQSSLTEIADTNDMMELKKDINNMKETITSATADDPTGFGDKLKMLEKEQKQIADEFNANLDFSGKVPVKQSKKKAAKKVAKKKVAKKSAKKVAKKSDKIKPPSLKDKKT